MSEGKQSRLSPAQRTDAWRRWKAGESLHEIGRAYGKPHNCIRCLLLPRGGIPPAARRRSGLSLTLAEREDISRGIASGSSIREIGSGLDRAASTVSREITHHGGRSAYRAHDADNQAWKSATAISSLSGLVVASVVTYFSGLFIILCFAAFVLFVSIAYFWSGRGCAEGADYPIHRFAMNGNPG
ncbi:MAG: helix-turn-helix domain-containing protein [Silvibacterium sp.]